MKTLDEIMNELKACGLPCAFVRFDEPQKTPFCILRMDKSVNVYSDLQMIDPLDTYVIELYYRDPKDRLAFEAFLNKDFIWQRYSTDVPIDDSVLMSGYDLL